MATPDQHDTFSELYESASCYLQEAVKKYQGADAACSGNEHSPTTEVTYAAYLEAVRGLQKACEIYLSVAVK
jgi:hypothetical protein